TAGEKTMATAWPYVEYMARWERQVERRQLFLRSYHFSRDSRSRRARSRAASSGPRRDACAAPPPRGSAGSGRASASASAGLRPRRGGVHGFRYGRLPQKAPPAAANAASVCLW
ncbi:hypothetical protein CFC21_074619, partial [Triticum aestivum]